MTEGSVDSPVPPLLTQAFLAIIAWFTEAAEMGSRVSVWVITVFLDRLNTFVHSEIPFSKQLTHRVKQKLTGQNDKWCLQNALIITKH